jgi:hypothetical protein
MCSKTTPDDDGLRLAFDPSQRQAIRALPPIFLPLDHEAYAKHISWLNVVIPFQATFISSTSPITGGRSAGSTPPFRGHRYTLLVRKVI